MNGLRRLATLLFAVTLPGCGDSALFSSDAIEIEGGKGTHVIGIYDGPSEHSYGAHPIGELPVKVESQGNEEIALAITSYEPVQVIVMGPGAGAVKAVYLDGYHRHSVKGLPAGARVVNYSGGRDFRPTDPESELSDNGGWGAGNVPDGYRHVSSGNDIGAERDAIESNAHHVLGLPIASITQAYRLGSINISQPDET